MNAVLPGSIGRLYEFKHRLYRLKRSLRLCRWIAAGFRNAGDAEQILSGAAEIEEELDRLISRLRLWIDHSELRAVSFAERVPTEGKAPSAPEERAGRAMPEIPSGRPAIPARAA